MPKKKKGAAEEKPLLGRPGNKIKMGILGLPNVGKSTLFNVLSSMEVPAENYAFCTIEPAKAKVPVPDVRHTWLCEKYQPKKRIQADLQVWDIAGLVKGAHEGKGLGNEFLSNIQAVDGLFHVVRAFTDKKIEHVEGDVDPVRDMLIICDELRMKDIATLEASIEKEKRAMRSCGDKAKKAEYAFRQEIIEFLKGTEDTPGTWISQGTWNPQEIEWINTYLAFTAKPLVFLVNVSAKKWRAGAAPSTFKAVKKWIKKNFRGAPVIPFSAKFEANAMAAGDEKEAFLKEAGVPSAVEKIVHTGYSSMSLIHYFTAGEDEVKCWTIRKGTKAPQAAAVIHGDFEKYFICAQVTPFEDLKECETEAAAKAAGKCRDQGKDYVVKDGDIMVIKHNAK